MSRADKNARHRAKRDAKRKQRRRDSAVSPVKRLATAPGEVEVWVSDDFQNFGQVECFVFKRAAGLSGMACFLIDRGVAGLKDAWVRINVRREDLDAAVQGSRDCGIPMRRGSVEEVRKLVAGGLRWAHEHGLRQPTDWQRTAQFIGGVEGWQDADVTGFVKEFSGHPDDLRQRLIGQPYEQFLLRSDIDFDFADDAPYLDQASGEYRNTPLDDEEDDDLDELSDDELEEIASELPEKEIAELEARFEDVATALTSQTGPWLRARGEEPSPELFEAWLMLIVSRLISQAAIPGESDESVKFASEMLRDSVARFPLPRRLEVDRAVDQAFGHLQTDTMMMRKALEAARAGHDG